MKEKRKQKISITIDRDVYEKALVLAEAENRTLSNYINYILRKAVSNKNKDK